LGGDAEMTWVGGFKSLQMGLREPRFTESPLEVHSWVRTEIGLISPLVATRDLSVASDIS
jgi:hypothetical protein